MKIRVMAFVDDENNDFFEGCRDENGSYVRNLMLDQMRENQAYYDISDSEFDDWMDSTFEGFNIGYDYFNFSRSASEILYDLEYDAYCELKGNYIDNEMYNFTGQILICCDKNDTESYLCFGDGSTYYGTIKEIEIEIDNNQDENCGNYEVEEVLDVKIEPPVFQLNISDLL